MRYVARYHLYLGCFFAPLILFYALSGAWQTLNLHRSTKDGRYRAPQILVDLSEVHSRQRWSSPNSQGTSPRRQEGEALLGLLPRSAFAWLSAFMGLGLATTALLGVLLAYQRSRGKRRWRISACLAGGCLFPLVSLIV